MRRTKTHSAENKTLRIGGRKGTSEKLATATWLFLACIMPLVNMLAPVRGTPTRQKLWITLRKLFRFHLEKSG